MVTSYKVHITAQLAGKYKTVNTRQGKTMFQEEFDFSLELVKKCGELIKTAFHGEKKVSEKSSATDLVTETDQMVEKLLIEGLRERFPDTRSGLTFLIEYNVSDIFFLKVHRRRERSWW